MDETVASQSPQELFFILAAVADFMRQAKPARRNTDPATRLQLEHLHAARAAIVAAIGTKAPAYGWIPCPICKKTLNYQVAPNGHIHASCTTECCVRWQE